MLNHSFLLFSIDSSNRNKLWLLCEESLFSIGDHLLNDFDYRLKISKDFASSDSMPKERLNGICVHRERLNRSHRFSCLSETADSRNCFSKPEKCREFKSNIETDNEFLTATRYFNASRARSSTFA